ncbi:MAG: hypothetical protein AWU57_199 [Marinobacter sp. T13-3]|nr:MAG: hypothetical protein AWU57_199 [Marinobacter sp. T13-3]
MSQSPKDIKHPIETLIENMYRCRSLIANAYDQQEVDVVSGDWSSLEPLISANLVRSRGRHTIRLNRRLVSILDQALRKNQIIAINENLGALLHAAQLNVRNMLDEMADYNYEQAAAYRTDAENRLLEIYDVTADDVNAIHERVTRNYGVKVSTSARKAEYEMYARQLDSLQEALNKIDLALKEEPFILDDSIQDFIANLDAESIGTVTKKIQSITKIIREHLFKIRQLEQKALKIRAVSRHLRNNPGFLGSLNLEDFDDTPDINRLPYLRAINPVKLRALPDIHDADIRAKCAEFILKQSQKHRGPKTQKPRENSELKSTTQPTDITEPPEIDRVIWRLFAQCLSQGQPVSAVEFWKANRPTLSRELQEWKVMEWLYMLSGYLDSDPPIPHGRKRTSKLIRPKYVTWPAPLLSGNKDLKDIAIQPVNKRVIANHGQISEPRQNDHSASSQGGAMLGEQPAPEADQSPSNIRKQRHWVDDRGEDICF